MVGICGIIHTNIAPEIAIASIQSNIKIGTTNYRNALGTIGGYSKTIMFPPSDRILSAGSIRGMRSYAIKIEKPTMGSYNKKAMILVNNCTRTTTDTGFGFTLRRPRLGFGDPNFASMVASTGCRRTTYKMLRLVNSIVFVASFCERHTTKASDITIRSFAT